MAKINEGRQEGDPCEICGTPLIPGKFGAYCKPCFIEYKNKKESMPESKTGYAPIAYKAQPKAEIKRTMDYKAEQIAKSQGDKEESMRLFSSGRDATLILTTMYKDNSWTDEQMQAKLKEWRNWLYQKIYKMDEDEYKNLNSPF